jgi:hypothetical protein
MDGERFRELFLVVIDGKDPWAWPAFTAGLVPKNRLHHHFGKRVGFQLLTLPPLGEACLMIIRLRRVNKNSQGVEVVFKLDRLVFSVFGGLLPTKSCLSSLCSE